MVQSSSLALGDINNNTARRMTPNEFLAEAGMQDTSFGELLGQFLERLEMSQAAFASRIGTGQSKVSDYVRGQIVPRMSTMTRMVQLLQGSGRFNDIEIQLFLEAYERAGGEPISSSNRIRRSLGRIREITADESLNVADMIFTLEKALESAYRTGYQQGFEAGRQSGDDAVGASTK